MKICLIGCGNMGAALLRGMLSLSGLEQVRLFNRSAEKAEALLASIALPFLRIEQTELAAAQGSDLVLLAVKPAGILPALQAILPALDGDEAPLVISVAAGVSLASMQQVAPQARLIRLMPNTPASVGAGASAFVLGQKATRADADLCRQTLSPSGLLVELRDESLMHAVIGVAGSAPAYFYELMDAMAAEGEAQGLPRELALQLSVQSMLGAARLQQETGQNPTALRNAVTSPNGTTLAALRKLNAQGIKDAWRAVVSAAAERSAEMEREQN